MKCVVDRIEGDYAVIEYFDKVLNFPRLFLPMEVSEGDVLDVIVLLDDDETGKLRGSIKELMDDVWEG